MHERDLIFGVVNDEIDEELPPAIRLATELGMQVISLRCYGLKPVTEMTAEEAAAAEALLAQSGLRVNMILTDCLKRVLLGGIALGRVADAPEFRENMEEFRKGVALAERFGAAARIFSFRREGMIGEGNPSPRLPRGGEIDEETLAKVVEGLRVACEIAGERGVTVGLENVRSCYANSGSNTRSILDAVGAPNLKLIWDPANSFVSGERAYPEGYAQVEPSDIIDVHVKDARVRDPATGWTEWVAVGQGEVDYRGQLAALLNDGYRGPFTIETHWRPQDYATRTTFEGFLGALSHAS